MAKIDLPECWVGLAEPLRAMLAEFERAAHEPGNLLDTWFRLPRYRREVHR